MSCSCVGNFQRASISFTFNFLYKDMVKIFVPILYIHATTNFSDLWIPTCHKVFRLNAPGWFILSIVWMRSFSKYTMYQKV